MKFEMTFKSYKSEKYESKQVWKGKEIIFVVSMWYHTFRKFWSVSYHIHYSKKYSTPIIDGWDYLELRKEARKNAFELMEKIKLSDIETRLSEFQRKCILEGG